MKFNVSSNELSANLQMISRVLNSKNSIPVLDCFLFEIRDGVLSVTSSDGETTMTVPMEVSDSDSDGRIAISARTLLDALRECAEQPLTFTVDTDTKEVSVDYQNGRYNLIGQDADEYPVSPVLGDNATRVEMDAPLLLDCINHTLFAVAVDELRPQMEGIFFDITAEDVTVVASDGHKLVRSKTTAAHGDGKASFIMPKKPAALLKNILAKEEGKAVIIFNEKNAMVTVGDFKLLCRMIDSRYPNYSSVIPKNNPYKLIVDRQLLIGALRRVSIFSSQASSLIKLNISDNKILLSAQDIDFSTSAHETLACQFTGSEMSIGFKATFLIDILGNISSDEVTIELADPSRPGVILPVEQKGDEDLLMLLMPMMLND